jgi:polysaccharide pyruvyl transferase WcaK-like protein
MENFSYDADSKVWTYQDSKKIIRYTNEDKKIVDQRFKSLDDEINVLFRAVKTMIEPDYKALMRKDYNETVNHPDLKQVDRNPLTLSGLVFSVNNLTAQDLLISAGRTDLFQFYSSLRFMDLALNDEANQSHLVKTSIFKSNKEAKKFYEVIDDMTRTGYKHRYK